MASHTSGKSKLILGRAYYFSQKETGRSSTVQWRCSVTISTYVSRTAVWRSGDSRPGRRTQNNICQLLLSAYRPSPWLHQLIMQGADFPLVSLLPPIPSACWFLILISFSLFLQTTGENPLFSVHLREMQLWPSFSSFEAENLWDSCSIVELHSHKFSALDLEN